MTPWPPHLAKSLWSFPPFFSNFFRAIPVSSPGVAFLEPKFNYPGSIAPANAFKTCFFFRSSPDGPGTEFGIFILF